MKPENNGMMVRGEIVVGFGRNGFLSMSMEDNESHHSNYAIAYTPWHRHDENPDVVESELRKLHDLYARFGNYSGAMMGYGYKPYNQE